jgi:hypothetical protein
MIEITFARVDGSDAPHPVMYADREEAELGVVRVMKMSLGMVQPIEAIEILYISPDDITVEKPIQFSVGYTFSFRS